jgi:mannose-6-phosphate isomerase-like protein (cupin superfamily)
MKHVEHFDNLEHYEQDSGANITYQFIVKPGTMGLLSAGRVRLKGPTHKADDVHDGWDQVYLILSGAGSVLVGENTYPVKPGDIIRIPKGIKHGVILEGREKLEYCYFNAFDSQDAIAQLCNEL